VRFMFLRRAAHGSINNERPEEARNEESGEGGYCTHEDPGSGMTWSPRAPTQAMHSWATVMPLRFATAVRVSTSLRL
jgi:hypothetical protein